MSSPSSAAHPAGIGCRGSGEAVLLDRCAVGSYFGSLGTATRLDCRRPAVVCCHLGTELVRSTDFRIGSVADLGTEAGHCMDTLGLWLGSLLAWAPSGQAAAAAAAAALTGAVAVG
jgi:hypothetical protein